MLKISTRKKLLNIGGLFLASSIVTTQLATVSCVSTNSEEEELDNEFDQIENDETLNQPDNDYEEPDLIFTLNDKYQEGQEVDIDFNLEDGFFDFKDYDQLESRYVEEHDEYFDTPLTAYAQISDETIVQLDAFDIVISTISISSDISATIDGVA